MNAAPRDRRLIRLAALACAFIAFLLGIKNNDFPFYYHIDEPGKVAQLTTGERNFNHPLLLLTATDLAIKVTGRTAEEIGPQATVRVGRTVSALFNALAVGMIALLAGSYGGALATGFVGLLGAIHFDLFEKAHYLKEDPALILGFAATFLALDYFLRNPSTKSTILLGLATGLASSGKYIGAITLLIALPFVLKKRSFSGAAVFLVSAIALFLAINYPLLTQEGRDQFILSLSDETSKVTGGTWQQRSRFLGLNFGYFERIFQMGRAYLIIFFVIGLFALCKKRQPASAWIVALFPFALAAILAVSLKTSGRYFLPATLAIVFTSGVGLAIAVRHTKPWLSALCIIIAFGGSLERLYKYESSFRKDPRKELAEFIRETLPPDAVILQGVSVHLPDPEIERYVQAPVTDFLPQEIISVKQPATYQEDRATYVAVTGRSYERYTKSKEKPKGSYAAEYAKNRAFYKALFKDNPPVWKRDARKVGTHNPPIRLYRVPGAP